MKSLLKLTFVDLKLLSRNMIAMFFTIIFPIIDLLLFGAMYGNIPTQIYGGRGSADMLVPGLLASMVIGTTAMLNLPFELVSRRQQGVLRRFRASPLKPATVLLAQLAGHLLLAILSSLLLVIVGRIFLKAALPNNWLLLVAAFLLGSLSMSAIGFLLAGSIHNINTARAVCMVVFFPMMFISGGTMPISMMPESIQSMSAFLPLTHVVNLVRSAYLDSAWNLPAALILAVLLVACAAISFRVFRWE